MSASVDYERSDREFHDPTHDFQGRNVGRTDTPETMLTDYPLRPGPDISIVCEKCKSFIALPQLKDHRQFHYALTKLRYGLEEPKNSDVLLKRRNFVLRKMKAAATKDKPVTPQQIEEINEAYEYLKAVMDGNYEEFRQVREDVNAQVGGVSLNCSPDCVYAVGMAASANERWKSYMEDARTFQDCFGEDKHKCFLGLFDGYHGRFAAEVAASELHKLLLSEMIKFDPRTKSVVAGNLLGDSDISHYNFERPDTKQSERALLYDESVGIIQNIINICEDKYNDLIKKMDHTPENSAKVEDDTPRKKKKKSPFERKMENAFSKAYYLLDILLSYGKDENSKIRWSGCSAATCVIQDLPKEEIGKDSSDVNDEDESVVSGLASGLEPPKTVGTIHVANAGNVHAVLVRGNRAYSLTKDHTPNNAKEKNRIIKDGGTLSDSTKECRVNGVLLTTRGLGNHGDKPLKRCVIVEPYTTSAPVDQYAQFLILASRGVWEVFSEKEAASLLIKLLPNNQIPAPSKLNSTIRTLFDEMKRPSSQESNSRKVSFSSNRSSSPKKSSEFVFGNRQRSATLASVAENQQEDGSNKSGQGSEVKGQGESQLFKMSSSSDEKTGKVENGSRPGSGINNRSENDTSKESGEKKSADGKTNQSHSTPTGSPSKESSNKRSRRYVDADMQTEIGSRNGDDSDDSGNEADIDSYLENISFPGGISRISMVDGPPSREQIQRRQAQIMAEHLVQAALLAGAKDNVTVMVVLLPGSGL